MEVVQLQSYNRQDVFYLFALLCTHDRDQDLSCVKQNTLLQ